MPLTVLNWIAIPTLTLSFVILISSFINLRKSKAILKEEERLRDLRIAQAHLDTKKTLKVIPGYERFEMNKHPPLD